MRVEKTVGKKYTTIRWSYSEEKISKKFPGKVEAEFSEPKNFIVTAGDDGVVRLIKPNGCIVSEFSYNNTGDCRFYVLAKSDMSDLGVTMVMAHDPEHKGERFWQHEIDVETMTVGGPKAKWR